MTTPDPVRRNDADPAHTAPPGSGKNTADRLKYF